MSRSSDLLSPLNNILTRLDVKMQTGNGFQACCPVHADRRPSLSLRETVDGKVLIHCFAGCTVEEIVAALGLQLRDLFPTASIRGYRGK